MPMPLLDVDSDESVWVELENKATYPVLTRKYQRVDIFSEQRVFHPEERGLITHGAAWTDNFRVKIFSLDENMKKKLLLKLTVDKLYHVTITPDGCSVRILHPDSIDKQLCAYERMEEVWDNSNYYETLRVPQDATTREIRLAYLKLAKIYHPDHNNHPQAALMFERITEAYHTLSDEEVRKRYDTHLRTDPGVLSKSYWRQVFLHWNRHKAIQVGISTLLCITGSVILLSSILAAPSGAALPASILGGAIGGGIFASGIGGISIAMSRQAALEDNRVYKRWLKYSFWYGVAGMVTGAVSAGVGGLLGTAVGGGMAAVVTSGAVHGGIQGFCFGVGSGIASDRWIELIKKLRIDCIAMDLVVSTLTGAATGLVFQSLLMTTAGAPSAVMGNAKFSAEQLAGNNGALLIGQKTQHPRKVLKRNRTNSAPLRLTYPNEDKETETETENETENESPDHNQNQDNLLRDSMGETKIHFHSASEPVCISTGLCNPVQEPESLTDNTPQPSASPIHGEYIGATIIENDGTPVEDDEEKIERKGEEEGITYDSETTEEENLPANAPLFPPEVDEFLQNKEKATECLNEAMLLFETVKDSWPAHFLQFYNHSRKKARMLVDYTLPSTDEASAYDTEDLQMVRNVVEAQEMFYLPNKARFIQIHFEHSSVGILWDPICSYQDFSHTFAYPNPICSYQDFSHTFAYPNPICSYQDFS
eukprot:CAMPEP_0206193200 /NCGR_PEP_ID=MMETSP0166-20121206/6425_1 /ASSEMBLY_ACC=CAM_ASM_000260 /TAXON_ID=95228 /ORGANISM="Vannella robusta, Strain DIVA3 518/3/11/1/6" /LENGTH=706 /DNA_ID=CAMNT_0053609867 /DNA_START=563 /DNA_END=2679 /DNA_ORIENTATION=-